MHTLFITILYLGIVPAKHKGFVVLLFRSKDLFYFHRQTYRRCIWRPSVCRQNMTDKQTASTCPIVIAFPQRHASKTTNVQLAKGLKDTRLTKEDLPRLFVTIIGWPHFNCEKLALHMREKRRNSETDVAISIFGIRYEQIVVSELLEYEVRLYVQVTSQLFYVNIHL